MVILRILRWRRNWRDEFCAIARVIATITRLCFTFFALRRREINTIVSLRGGDSRDGYAMTL